jgi:hypothetical protein
MKLNITEPLTTTPWIPGILNPEHRGYYQRDRRTRVPSPTPYIDPKEFERFHAEYPPAANVPPAIGSQIELEYWNGRQWMIDGLSQMQSYVGPGKEKCYWRGIEFDPNVHNLEASVFTISW